MRNSVLDYVKYVPATICCHICHPSTVELHGKWNQKKITTTADSTHLFRNIRIKFT